MPKKQKQRCEWVKTQVDPRYLEYHDREWGVPVHDDRKQFEFLLLEGAQAGLSWWTVLNKREGYRKAFADFDPERSPGSPTGESSGCSRTGPSSGTGSRSGPRSPTPGRFSPFRTSSAVSMITFGSLSRASRFRTGGGSSRTSQQRPSCRTS